MRQSIKTEATACSSSLEITKFAAVDNPQPDGPTKTVSEPLAIVVTSLSSIADRAGLITSPRAIVIGYPLPVT